MGQMYFQNNVLFLHSLIKAENCIQIGKHLQVQVFYYNTVNISLDTGA